MFLRHRDAKPDERKDRIRQPIAPAQKLVDLAIASPEVQPHIKKFVEADARYVIGLEALRFECLSRDVIVAFERGNCPTALPLGNQFFGASVKDPHTLATVR